jgi:hypothetical protein
VVSRIFFHEANVAGGKELRVKANGQWTVCYSICPLEPRPFLNYAPVALKPEFSPRVAGRELRCGHCDGTAFVVARGRPASELCAVFGVPPEAVGESADVYVCCNCGRVEVHFATTGGARGAAARFAAVECPRCNMIVHADEERCASCGWVRPNLSMNGFPNT